MTAEYLQGSRFDQHMRVWGRALTLRCRTRCRSFPTYYAESADPVPRVSGPVVRFTDLSLVALVTWPTGPVEHLPQVRPRREACPAAEGADEIGGIFVAQLEADIGAPAAIMDHLDRHLKPRLLQQRRDAVAVLRKVTLQAAK